MRFLIAFCVGIGATLAWQSYGDTARAMIASSYPEYGWLAPQSAVAQTGSATGAPSSIASADPQDLKSLSFNLAAIGQRVDQIAASQDKVSRDISARLAVAKQEILDRMSPPSAQPAAAPVRKPASPAPQAAVPAPVR
jgi:hypothetical protein